MKEYYYTLSLHAKVGKKRYKFKDISSKRLKKLKNPSLRNILMKVYANLKNILSLTKKNITLPRIVNCLKQIIPMEYFGTSFNVKKFFFIVKRILTQTRGEYIHTSVLYKKFDYKAFVWLNKLEPAETQVLHANVLLLQAVVKPFIARYYCFVNRFQTREFLIFPKSKMDSFIDRNLAANIRNTYLIKVSTSHKNPVDDKVSWLYFVPKQDMSQLVHRPLCFGSKKSPSTIRCLKDIKHNLKRLIAQFKTGSESSLFFKWKRFLKTNDGRKRLYATKLDLLDAFGMIRIDSLKMIIKDDATYLRPDQKEFIYQTLDHQYVYVRGRKQMYKWNHGLLQGKTLSPLLCELYLSSIMYKNLKQFDKPNIFLHRSVDDILFISTTKSDVTEFEKLIFGLSILNVQKSQKYFNEPDDNPRIVFCGKIFNLATRETGNAYEFKKGESIRGKCKIWNVDRQFREDQAKEFINNAMRFSNVNFCFSSFELSTTGNSVNTVLRNIFDGMCLVGFKFLHVIDSIDYLFDNNDKRSEIILQSIHYITTTYFKAIQKAISKYKGKYYEPIFSNDKLQFLCYRAFILIFRKKNVRYKQVISTMKTFINNNTFFIDEDFKYFLKLPQSFENISIKRDTIY